MPLVTRHSLITVVVLAAASLLIIGLFIWSGIYNIGADDTHTRPVYSLLQTLRERSINVRASKLHPPPSLKNAAMIRQGAGNYAAMCTGCHLAPGMQETELSKGLYPAPPNFAKVPAGDPSHHFWVIKHGIKASGMPAWGKSMHDDYIWGMVAFLQELPRLNAGQYQALVASSGGHEHGGGETKPHAHAEGMPDDHGDMPTEGPSTEEAKPHAHPPGTPAHQDKAADPHAGMDMSTDKAADESKPHAHPPGTPADHHKTAAPAKPTPKPAVTKPTAKKPVTPPATDEHAGMTMPETPPAEQADDGHDHQH